MRYIRILNFEKYHRGSSRFPPKTFRKNKGGISLISEDCAISTSGTHCIHIPKFYGPLVTGSRIVFWAFESTDLEEEHSENFVITPDNSNGDDCHFDLIINNDDNNEKSESFFTKYCNPPNIYYCCNNILVQIIDVAQYGNLPNLIKDCM